MFNISRKPDYKDHDKILQMQYIESIDDINQCNYCEVLYNDRDGVIGAIIGDGTCYKLLSPECYETAKKYNMITCSEVYDTTVKVYLTKVIIDSDYEDSYSVLDLHRDLDSHRKLDSKPGYVDINHCWYDVYRHLVWKYSDTKCKNVYNIWIKMKNKTKDISIDHSTALKLILNGILDEPELKYFINTGLAIAEGAIQFKKMLPKARHSSPSLLRLVDIINKLPDKKQTSNAKYCIVEGDSMFKSIGADSLSNSDDYAITTKYIGLDGDTIGYRLKGYRLKYVNSTYHSDISKNNLIELMRGKNVKNSDGIDELIKIDVIKAELKDNDIIINDDTVKEVEVYIRCAEAYIADVNECNTLYKIEFKDIFGNPKELLCNDSEVHSIIQSINIDGLSLNNSGAITVNAERLNYSDFEQAEIAFENRDYAVLSDLLIHTVLMKRISGR